MSKAIKKKLADRNKKIPLTDAEFAYISSLDNVGRSFEHYLKELKTAYLQTITLNHGYKTDDSLELSIDLQSEDHILNVKVIEQG